MLFRSRARPHLAGRRHPHRWPNAQLAGTEFVGRWGSRATGDLVTQARSTMPPDNPGGLPPETYQDKWWITEFEDRSTPRPGTDELYFEHSLDRGPVARPPIIITTYKNPWWAGPLVVIVLIVIGGVALALIRRYYIGTDEEIEAAGLLSTPEPEPSEPDASDTGSRTEPRRWS